MSEKNVLPQGWKKTTIGAIVSFDYGKGLRKDRRDGTGKIPVYGSNGVVGYHSEALVDSPCLIVGRKGTAGAVHLSKTPCWPIDTTYYVLPPNEISLNYLFHLFTSLRLGQLDKSTAIPGLNRNDAYAVDIPLPPLPEQERIVAKIEELFTQLDAGVAELEQAKAQLKRYRQSVLKSAVEGELTREWRESHFSELEPASQLLGRVLEERREKWERFELEKMEARGRTLTGEKWKSKYPVPFAPEDASYDIPETWAIATLDQLSFHVTSGSRGWAKYYSKEGNLFIRVGNFNRNEISLDLKDVVFVDEPDSPEAFRTRLKAGDLLITVTADVGMVGVVEEKTITNRSAYINQHVSLVRPVDTDITQYVAFSCASEVTQKQFREKEYGATKKGLNLTDIKTTLVPFPPLEEQQRIVEMVERRLSVADEIEKELEQALVRSERLRQAVLKSAFEGRLV